MEIQVWVDEFAVLGPIAGELGISNESLRLFEEQVVDELIEEFGNQINVRWIWRPGPTEAVVWRGFDRDEDAAEQVASILDAVWRRGTWVVEEAE